MTTNLVNKNLFIIFFLCFLSNCKPKNLTPREKYKLAIEKFEEKKYNDAIPFFLDVLLTLSGTDEEINSRILLCKCYYYTEKYKKSADSCLEFFNIYSEHEFAEEALYLNIKSLDAESNYFYLDQSETKEALLSIDTYFFKYPYGKYLKELQELKTKLLKKLYDKSLHQLKVFFDLGYYNGALHFAETLLKEEPSSCNLEDIIYIKLKSLYNLQLKQINQNLVINEHKSNFVKTYISFKREYVNSKYLKELSEIYNSFKI